MNKNSFAKVPPMGWNSYDYYDTTVNEEQVKANADYMAAHLKDFGWEYIVVDIQWYAHKAGSMREQFQYIPFSELEIDEYSRLLPDPERFPSSADGKGFGPLAEYMHSLGLKFGIHIMRGIPRMAAQNHMKIKGSDVTADMAANPSSICPWNPDMYGLYNSPAGQAYYDSLLELYASWGWILSNAMISATPATKAPTGKISIMLPMKWRCWRMPSNTAAAPLYSPSPRAPLS